MYFSGFHLPDTMLLKCPLSGYYFFSNQRNLSPDAFSPARKPDVLIIPDDFIAMIVNQYLLLMRGDGLRWMPHIIYSTNRQIPIIPKELIRGDRFEMDIMKYAESAVSLLLNVIRGREKEERSVVVEPVLYKMEAE